MISTITSNFISLIPTIIYKYVDTGNPLINSFVILLIITIVTNVFNLKNIDLYFLSLYFKLKLIILRDKSDGINLSSGSLYITNSSNQSFIINQTLNISGTSNTTLFYANLTNGNYSWLCSTNDT